MNFFLDYAICNRGTSAYAPKDYQHLDQGTTSFPACSGTTPSCDSYNSDGRFGATGVGAAGPNTPHQQSPSYPPPPPLPANPASLGIPFAGSSQPGAGYSVPNCSPSFINQQFYLNPQETEGAYFQPSAYSANVAPAAAAPAAAASVSLGSVSDGFCASTGQFQQHLYGPEQGGYLQGAFSNLSPPLHENKDPRSCSAQQCPMAATTATQTFDWMKVKRNPPKTGKASPSLTWTFLKWGGIRAVACGIFIFTESDLPACEHLTIWGIRQASNGTESNAFLPMSFPTSV